MSIPQFSSYFRPDDEGLPPHVQLQIQGARLLSLLGAVIYPLFGLLRAVSTPEATDPLWIRFAISGALIVLFVASYLWSFVRRTYLEWIHGMLYVIIAWFAGLAAFNEFAGDFAISFLVTFTIFGALIGFHARRIGPVLWFTGFVVLVTGGSVALGPSPKISLVFLFASIGSVVAIVSLFVLWGASARKIIRRHEQSLRTITENVSDGIYRSTPEGGLVYANQAFVDIFGYESQEELLSIPPDRLYADPSRREELQQRANENGGLPPTEVEFRRKDGSTFTGRICEEAVRDDTGAVQYTDGTLTDITERKKWEREIARRKALLEAQAEATIDGLLVVDSNRNLVFYNDRFLDIWGIPEHISEESPSDPILDEIFLDYVTDVVQNPEEFREKVRYLYNHPTEESRDLIHLTDGRWLDRYSTPVVGNNGTYFGRLWIFRDVANQKQREQKLKHKATHDELTGVPNRAALHDELQEAIETTNNGSSALLYLDINNFKEINDNLGHVKGDELLVRLADRLQGVVRDSDLAARVGGDEFAVCLSNVKTKKVYQIAERIYKELSRPFDLDGQEVSVPPSIGVVSTLSRFSTVEEALRDADTAMYEAKKMHKSKEHVSRPFVVFEDSQPRELNAPFPSTERNVLHFGEKTV